MTQDQFWEALAERVKKHGFQLFPHWMEGNQYSMIREKKTRCCPITAVARDHGRPDGPAGDVEYVSAAKQLDMDEDFASSLASAADGNFWAHSPNFELRKKLLEVLQLEERG